MSGRYARGAAGLLLLGTTLLAGATTPAAASAPYTATVMSWTVHVGPGRATACTVVGELFVPRDASASHPVPAILTTNGFGGSYTDQTHLAEYFAGRQDYVVLAYSGLGFGGSGCNIELDSPQWDGAAASQLVSYLGTVPEVVKEGPDAPDVGMIGLSYGGGVQFSAASIDPRIRALVPQITWNDLAYSLAPNNTDPNLVFTDTPPGVLKAEWIAYFFQDGLHGSLTHPTATPFPPSTCPGYDPRICPELATSAGLGYPTPAMTALLRASSMVSFHAAVHAPTLLMQGEADTLFTIDEAVATYQELKADRVPVKLVIQSWGHSNGVTPAPGELSYSSPGPSYERTLITDWFAKYLKGKQVNTGPAVEYFRPWVAYNPHGSAEPAYGSAPGWPVGHTMTLYLSGDGSLTPTRRTVVAGTATFVNPGSPASYSETSAVQFLAPFSQIPPTDTPGTFASFSSAPLPAPLDSVGVPTLSFTLAATPPSLDLSPAEQPVLFAKIYDVLPDGTRTLVDRLVSPVRIADPGHPVTITLPAQVRRFPAGSRIDLVLAATDSAYLGNRVPQTYSIAVDPARPPMLSLPVTSPAHQDGGGPRATGSVPG
ncbi:MAG: CocE/NonD family hydrolase [Actinomycetes bacterium]